MGRYRVIKLELSPSAAKILILYNDLQKYLNIYPTLKLR